MQEWEDGRKGDRDGEGERGRERGRKETGWTGLSAGIRKESKRRVPGLDEKGPNLFSGRQSTPPPAKRLTTVWPSSYNPYSKRTEKPPPYSPPNEERVERPEQKLRGSQSTGEACILSPGPPCFPVSSLIIVTAPFKRLFHSRLPPLHSPQFLLSRHQPDFWSIIWAVSCAILHHALTNMRAVAKIINRVIPLFRDESLIERRARTPSQNLS